MKNYKEILTVFGIITYCLIIFLNIFNLLPIVSLFYFVAFAYSTFYIFTFMIYFLSRLDFSIYNNTTIEYKDYLLVEDDDIYKKDWDGVNVKSDLEEIEKQISEEDINYEIETILLIENHNNDMDLGREVRKLYSNKIFKK